MPRAGSGARKYGVIELVERRSHHGTIEDPVVDRESVVHRFRSSRLPPESRFGNPIYSVRTE